MDLLFYLGILLVIFIRLGHLYVYNYVNCGPASSSSADGSKPNVNESPNEGSPLLEAADSSPADTTDRAFNTRRRVVCSAAAVGYMAVTALGMYFILIEAQG
jgi:hypothetical protein